MSCRDYVSSETNYDVKACYDYAYTNSLSASQVVSNIDDDLHIRTKWFGDKTNKKIKCDCLYIRLHNVSENQNTKYIKIKSITMTDIGVETSEKEISDIEFDSLTDTAYIRYQPQYQTCVAISFDIQTNCPIVSMSIGYTPLDESAQISVINI